MADPTRDPNVRAVLLALLAFAVFSTHDVLVKLLGATYAPVQIVFFSTLFGFPIVTVMLMQDTRDGNLRPRHPWWVLLRTGASVVTAVSGFYAFSTLPMAQTYAIIFASPLLITVLAVPMLGERVGWRRSLAVIVGLVGVLVVLRPGGTALALGHVAALAAACCSAVSAVIMRKIGGRERSAVMLLYPMMANALVTGCLLPFVYRPMPGAHLGGVALIALLAFVATLCHLAAYRAGSAVVVAPMQYSQILWAVFWGALVFGETPDGATALGASIIIASGLYVVLRENRRNVSATRPVSTTRTRYLLGTGPRISTMPRLFRGRPRRA